MSPHFRLNQIKKIFRFKLQGAKIEAAKEMGYRDGLDTFRNPKKHDYRGVIQNIFALKF